MALEVGIVGLPGSGKSTLFRALTGQAATGDVGMADIPDERLPQVAEVVHAKKVTPATIRLVEVRGTGPALLGNLRQVDALLVVLDGWSGASVPADDLETLNLELLVADRDHVERRLERATKQAKSGDPNLRAEVAELERLLAHLDAGGSLADWASELPKTLEPLTTKPLLAVENGPSGIDLQLEAELAEMAPEEAAEYREGPSALDEVVRRLTEALDLVVFFTAGRERDARVDAPPRPDALSTRPGRSTPTSRAGSSARRSCAGTTWCGSAPTRRSRARGCSSSRARRTRSPTATSSTSASTCDAVLTVSGTVKAP